MLSVFSNFLRIFPWSNIWSILEHIPCKPEKNRYPPIAEWRISCLSVRSSWFIVLFKSSFSLSFFYLDVLSSIESGLLKYPIIIVELSISAFKSSNVWFIYFGALLFVEYMFIIVTSSWIDLLSIYDVLLCNSFLLKIHFV